MKNKKLSTLLVNLFILGVMAYAGYNCVSIYLRLGFHPVLIGKILNIVLMGGVLLASNNHLKLGTIIMVGSFTLDIMRQIRFSDFSPTFSDFTLLAVCIYFIYLNYKISKSHFHRGYALAHKKEFDKAIEEYNKGIELEPDNTRLYYNRGYAYLCKEDYAKAIKDYSKAIEIAPDNVDAYVARSYAHSRQKNYAQALDDCTKAIELKPDFALAYYYRGYAYHCKKKYSKAIADYDKALELDPSNADARTNRDKAYAAKAN